MQAGGGLGKWLEERCKKERLTLRQAATRTGLSHATIADSTNGDHHRLALEDKLLILAGYRSERPQEKELTEPMARPLDKLSEFNEPQLRIMECFCEFLSEEAKR